MIVNISNKNFRGKNREFDPLNVPTNNEILQRVGEWWQLRKRHDNDWEANPKLSPRALLGVYRSHRDSFTIIASAKIDTERNGAWCLQDDGRKRFGLLRVPVDLKSDANKNLDFLRLRGRRIDVALPLKFGSVRQKFFRIFPEDSE